MGTLRGWIDAVTNGPDDSQRLAGIPALLEPPLAGPEQRR